jgi:hypothetical protein
MEWDSPVDTRGSHSSPPLDTNRYNSALGTKLGTNGHTVFESRVGVPRDGRGVIIPRGCS